MWAGSASRLPREANEGSTANREYSRGHVGPAFLQGHMSVSWIGIDLCSLVFRTSKSHWIWPVGCQKRTPKSHGSSEADFQGWQRILDEKWGEGPRNLRG